MQLGMVGLGRMGGNIVRRLHAGRARLRRAMTAIRRRGGALAGEGARPRPTLAELVAALDAPRAVWVMLPAGRGDRGDGRGARPRCSRPATRSSTAATRFWKDDVRRAGALRRTGIALPRRRHERRRLGARARLLPDDRRRRGGRASGSTRSSRRWRPAAATSRATPGRDGRDAARRAGLPPCRAERRRPLRQDDPQRHRVRHDAGLSPRASTSCATPARRSSPAEHRFDLDLADIAEVWRRGSVVTSWLLDLTAAALAEDATLAGYTGHVAGFGRGPLDGAWRRSRRRCRPRC